MTNATESAPELDKKIYHTPSFEEFGALKNLTLGGSPDPTDSGGNPGPPP